MLRLPMGKNLLTAPIHLIKRFTYNPHISRLVWRLHVAGVLRSVYYWLNRPKDDVIHTSIGEASAAFVVHTPWELRSLDPSGDMGKERHVLEKVLSLSKKGDVIYDIGSNFGIYTILLANSVGPTGYVAAFEPEEQAYTHLLANIDLNGLSNVRAFRLALSDSNREEKLFLQHTGASRLNLPTVVSGGHEFVTLIKGDDLVEEENLIPPRIVKVDVEGHEGAVIKGLSKTLARPECQIVLCEIHPPLLPENDSADQILSFLKSIGFNKIEILQRGTSEFHALAQKT